MASHLHGQGHDALGGLAKPVTSYLDIARNEPIMYQNAGATEAVDEGTDLMAPVKVWKYSRRLWAQLLAEFIGMMIFQIYGGSSYDSVAAFGNGITLVVIIYATANVSGGHLNPAVTFAQCLTGHISWGKGGLYVCAQMLGAIFGALWQAALMPGVSVGCGNTGPGCFTHTKGLLISGTQLFFWELFMTFTLVSTVYATAITKPGHGNIAPLAIGFSLFASAFVGGPFTGAALNPARVLGPAMVFHCYWSHAFVYVFGQLFGASIAAITVLPLYGFGQFGSMFDARFFSFMGLQDPRAERPSLYASAVMDEETVPMGRSTELATLAVKEERPTPPRPSSSKPSLHALAEETSRRPPPSGANYNPRPGSSDSAQWQLGARA